MTSGVPTGRVKLKCHPERRKLGAPSRKRDGVSGAKDLLFVRSPDI